MIRWLESNGYDVSYQSGVDTDRSGSLLTNHKVFLSVGHDEYWSGNQRANVDRGPRRGREPGLLLGQRGLLEDALRDRPSTDRTPTTGPWSPTRRPTPTPRSIPPRPGPGPGEILASARPPTGASPRTGSPAPSGRSSRATTPSPCPAAQGKDRLWRNTSMATLAPGTVGKLAPELARLRVGRRPRQRRPARRACSTCRPPRSPRARSCSTTAPPSGSGTATHSMTTYRAPSGALVFGAGHGPVVVGSGQQP